MIPANSGQGVINVSNIGSDKAWPIVSDGIMVQSKHPIASPVMTGKYKTLSGGFGILNYSFHTWRQFHYWVASLPQGERGASSLAEPALETMDRLFALAAPALSGTNPRTMSCLSCVVQTKLCQYSSLEGEHKFCNSICDTSRKPHAEDENKSGFENFICNITDAWGPWPWWLTLLKGILVPPGPSGLLVNRWVKLRWSGGLAC